MQFNWAFYQKKNATEVKWIYLIKYGYGYKHALSKVVKTTSTIATIDIVRKRSFKTHSMWCNLLYFTYLIETTNSTYK